MISATYNTAADSRAINGSSGSWSSRNYVEFTTVTETVIKNIEIPLISYVNSALVAVEITLNGTSVFYREFTLSDSLNTKIYYPFSVNVTTRAGDIVKITAITEAANNYCSPYGSNNSVTFDAPFLMGSGYFWTCIEVILDVDYALSWVLDGQNDGYAYPASADPTEFTFFAKDADGYPLNWGVWKLDDQNEGYPWPTGYLPIHVAGGGIYKKINGILYPVSIYKKVNGVLYPVMVYKKVNGSLVPI